MILCKSIIIINFLQISNSGSRWHKWTCLTSKWDRILPGIQWTWHMYYSLPTSLTTSFFSSTREEVFRLEVSMANFLGMKILHNRSHLIEIKAFVFSIILSNCSPPSWAHFLILLLICSCVDFKHFTRIRLQWFMNERLYLNLMTILLTSLIPGQRLQPQLRWLQAPQTKGQNSFWFYTKP